MRGEVRKQPQLRARQAHRPGAGRPLGRRHALVQLPRLLDERAHVGTQLEHLLGLGEHRAGRAGVGEREMGACELEPDFDRRPGNAVVEQRPQTVGARECRTGILVSSLVDGDTRRRRERERARPVVAEARLLDDVLCRPRASPCLAPGSPLGGEERELCVCQVDLFGGAGRQPRLDGCREVVRRTIGRAEQRVRDTPDQQRGRPPVTLGREQAQRPIGVGERPLDTVGHHVRPQGGDPGLDRGAAVRERKRGGRPVSESEPSLGLCSAAR